MWPSRLKSAITGGEASVEPKFADTQRRWNCSFSTVSHTAQNLQIETVPSLQFRFKNLDIYRSNDWRTILDDY